jgi:DNA-binding FadR family transcriptional regulator
MKSPRPDLLNGRVEVASAKNSCQRPDERVSTICDILCTRFRAGWEAFDQLRGGMCASAEAEARSDRLEAIRPSGEFHIGLAQVAGNLVLAKLLERLAART